MQGESPARLKSLRQEAAPLRNQIIAALRSAIETGLLQPGTRLIERDLCEQLNVSRTSLREALRELQALGVLASIDNRGLIVGALTDSEAANAYSIRAVLEALVVGQFVSAASDAEIEQVAALGAKLSRAYMSGSVERILDARRAFFDCLCTGARNAMAFEIINLLTLRTSILRSRSLSRKERQRQSIGEIETIVDAIRSRDATTAERAVTEHIANAAESALGPAARRPVRSAGGVASKPPRSNHRSSSS